MLTLLIFVFEGVRDAFDVRKSVLAARPASEPAAAAVGEAGT
jgi:hypothetical protein